MRAALLLWVVCICLSSRAIAAADECTDTGEARTEFGKWQIDGIQPLHPGDRKGPISADGRYLRMMVEAANGEHESWQFVIRDSGQRVVQILDAADFRSVPYRWTKYLKHGVYWLELNAPQGSAVSIKFPYRIDVPVSWESGHVYVYSRQDPAATAWVSIQDIEGRQALKVLGDNVGLLIVGDQGGVRLDKVPSCSAIALPPNLLLTAWHCGVVYGASKNDTMESLYWYENQRRASLVDLSFDDDEYGREFQPGQLLADSRELDYALLQLRPLAIDRAIGAIRIASARLPANASLTIVHHPMGEPKKVSSQLLGHAACAIVDPRREGWRTPNQRTEFTHRCDTEGGSSGAPIFDEDGDLVGLHHLGFARITNSGQCDKLNKAVWIDAILDDIKSKATQARERRQTSSANDRDRHIVEAWNSIEQLRR